MKRNIIFRGLKKDKSGFVYGMPTLDFEYIFNKDQVDGPDRYEVIPDTVTLFTEIKDENGIEQPNVLNKREKITLEIITAILPLEVSDWMHNSFSGEPFGSRIDRISTISIDLADMLIKKLNDRNL